MIVLGSLLKTNILSTCTSIMSKCVPALRIQTSGLACVEEKCRSRSVAAKSALHAAPDDFCPYSVRVMINTLPWSLPVSICPSNHIFSQHGAFKLAFVTSPAKTSKSFNPAIRNASWMLSLDKTLEYVIDPGASVICPPATKRALRVKSILTSNVTWQVIS